MSTTDIDRLREEYLLPYQAATLVGYARGLELWFDWCASQHLHPLEVRRADVERYVRHLVTSGRMPATVRYRVAPVRGFYRLAYLEGVMPRDPGVMARLPHVG